MIAKIEDTFWMVTPRTSDKLMLFLFTLRPPPKRRSQQVMKMKINSLKKKTKQLLLL